MQNSETKLQWQRKWYEKKAVAVNAITKSNFGLEVVFSMGKEYKLNLWNKHYVIILFHNYWLSNSAYPFLVLM